MLACCSSLFTAKAHGRPLRCLADGLCVDRVVLLPFDEWLHISGRDQADAVPQLHEFAGPVVGAAAGLQRHQTAGVPREEL